MATDITAVVRERLAGVLRELTADAPGYGYAVSWSPCDLEGGGVAVAWMLMITLDCPGDPVPFAVTSDPVVTSSVPSDLQLETFVRKAVAALGRTRRHTASRLN